MSGARLIIDFHGLAVPHSLLVQALSALAPWMEEIDDFGFLPEARPLPADGQPLVEIRLEGLAGPEERAIAEVMTGLLIQSLPAGTRISAPDI